MPLIGIRNAVSCDLINYAHKRIAGRGLRVFQQSCQKRHKSSHWGTFFSSTGGGNVGFKLRDSPLEFISNYTYVYQPSAETRKDFGHTTTASTLNNTSTSPQNYISDVAKDAKAEEPIDQRQESIDTSSSIPFEIVPKEPRQANQSLSWRTRLKYYIALSKPRLTILVMLSAVTPYSLAPYPGDIASLVFLTIGTTLCSASANAINMGREPDFDKLMGRTKSRPVARGYISPKEAYAFAAVTGLVGTLILYFGVNPVVAGLGLGNIVLYAGIYTSLKRVSIINTWVGAIVGAIPPLMGWATAGPLTDLGAWCLAGILYAWQFPHFNALSHGIKDEYKKAGYVMTSWKNPGMNARVSLRYAVILIAFCYGLSYFDVTDWYFQLDSSIFNLWFIYAAYNFWKQQKICLAKNAYDPKNPLYNSPPLINERNIANSLARKLFWASVWYLPAVFVLAMLHKKGQWDWLLDDDYSDTSVVRLSP